MSETENISRLAEIVSKDLFGWFKWHKAKPTNENWECVINHHSKNTHPSDVVFYYDDPYSGDTQYVNTDLKSYAAKSITKGSIETALTSLALSVECANVSQSWQDKFLMSDEAFGQVSGLLFIYNHDDQYDLDFSSRLEQVDFSAVKIAEDNFITVMGPDLIRRLNDIVQDIKSLVASDELPRKEGYTFFYPDLIRARRSGDEWDKPATLQSLTAPWLIIKHRKTNDQPEGFLIYYNLKGDTVEEFIYLIDAMSHYQMFSGDLGIRIRFTESDHNASQNFEKAKHEYLRMWGDDEGRQKQMSKIEVRKIDQFARMFNPMEIGMREND